MPAHRGFILLFPFFSAALVCMCLALAVSGHWAVLQQSAALGRLASPREEGWRHFLWVTSAFLWGLLASLSSCFKAAWQRSGSFLQVSCGSSSWLLISLPLLLYKP